MLSYLTYSRKLPNIISEMRVTMVDKNKAVVCCFLATPAIMLSEKKKIKGKMCSKKWYLKRNI